LHLCAFTPFFRLTKKNPYTIGKDFSILSLYTDN